MAGSACPSPKDRPSHPKSVSHVTLYIPSPSSQDLSRHLIIVERATLKPVATRHVASHLLLSSRQRRPHGARRGSSQTHNDSRASWVRREKMKQLNNQCPACTSSLSSNLVKSKEPRDRQCRLPIERPSLDATQNWREKYCNLGAFPPPHSNHSLESSLERTSNYTRPQANSMLLSHHIHHTLNSQLLRVGAVSAPST